MLSARQLLLTRRARDRAIGMAIAPIGAVALLPDPDFRRRVLRCVSHVGLWCVARLMGRTDRMGCTRAKSAMKPGTIDILFAGGQSAYPTRSFALLRRATRCWMCRCVSLSGRVA